MDIPKLTIHDWQRSFPDELSCQEELMRLRWSSGFQCPVCSHDKAYLIKPRHIFECAHCSHHTSLTANTVFHSTKIPLYKWFLSIFWVSSNKCISGTELARRISVSTHTACKILSKLRNLMKHKETLYHVKKKIKLDEVLINN